MGYYELYDFFMLLGAAFEGNLLEHRCTMFVCDDTNQLISERLGDAYTGEINFDRVMCSKLTFDLLAKDCGSRARREEVLLRVLFQQKGKG